MHILRAQKSDTNKEIALRKFFETKGSASLINCENVMQALDIIHKITTEFEGDNEISSLWRIMDTYPNKYWNYPLYVFLHKYGKLNAENEFELRKEKLDEFKILLKETVRYFFLKGVIRQGGSNSVKEAVYKVYSKIESNDNYLNEYRNNISKSDQSEFGVLLEENRIGRYNRGLVLIAAYLNPRQDMREFAQLLSGEEKYHIEHILPQAWNDYDGWNKDTHKEDVNLLGNLMPLSQSLNIKASNEFFTRKKEKYKESSVQDALDLIHIPNWTRDRLLERNSEKIELLREFFSN